MNLSVNNATINVLTSGIYLINYNAAIQLNNPSIGDWFTIINVNGSNIKGPASRNSINQSML